MLNIILDIFKKNILYAFEAFNLIGFKQTNTASKLIFII